MIRLYGSHIVMWATTMARAVRKTFEPICRLQTGTDCDRSAAVRRRMEPENTRIQSWSWLILSLSFHPCKTSKSNSRSITHDRRIRPLACFGELVWWPSCPPRTAVSFLLPGFPLESTTEYDQRATEKSNPIEYSPPPTASRKTGESCKEVVKVHLLYD